MKNGITATLLRQIQKIKEADAEPLFPLIQEAFLDFFAACYAARNENKVQAVKKSCCSREKAR